MSRRPLVDSCKAGRRSLVLCENEGQKAWRWAEQFPCPDNRGPPEPSGRQSDSIFEYANGALGDSNAPAGFQTGATGGGGFHALEPRALTPNHTRSGCIIAIAPGGLRLWRTAASSERPRVEAEECLDGWA